MILSALEHFEPLDGNQIKNNIAEHSSNPKDYNETIKLPFKNGCLSEKENFSLTIDRAVLEQHPSIRIANCNHFNISSFLHHITPSHNKKFFIEIIDCEHFTIEGINCSSGRSIIFITGSSSFTIRECRFSNAEGYGVIINNGHDFKVSECHFDNNLSAGILIVGQSFNGEVLNCVCTRSRGFFNHDAGSHLCHTSPNVTTAQIPEQIHEELPITSKTQRPHHIVIKNCTITHCRAQGIYLEGAVNCLVENNILLNNNKEGICFDWGSCYNLFCRNIVSLNGERRKLSPVEIKVDFISEYPLLENGSSSMKLPGISLDNGCMNLIQENKIANNYGGGIKMIRTALFNKITNNQILYNAIGTNEYVPFFHGITALGLGAISREFAKKNQPLLDFMPSILNSITHNTIKEDIAAIFYDKVSSNNFASDNIISQQVQTHCNPAKTYLRAKAFVKRFFANTAQKSR